MPQINTKLHVIRLFRLTLSCRMGPCIAGMLDDFDMKKIMAKIQIWNLTPNNLYLLYSPLDKSATFFKVGTQLKGGDGRIYSSKKILHQYVLLWQYFFTWCYRVSRRCSRTKGRCTPLSSGVTWCSCTPGSRACSRLALRHHCHGNRRRSGRSRRHLLRQHRCRQTNHQDLRLPWFLFENLGNGGDICLLLQMYSKFQRNKKFKFSNSYIL